MNLQELLKGIAKAPSLDITGLSDDSRQIEKGNIFIAYQGKTYHGLDFVNEALQSGAKAVLWDCTTGDQSLALGKVPFIAINNLADQLGVITNRWHKNPSEKINVIGITGTNGKTTIAFLIAQCLNYLGSRCAYIGTLGSGVTTIRDDLSLTTPRCLELQKKISNLCIANTSYLALEVSSHALSQKRIDGIKFDTVIFSNLTRDHIDYHGNMASYGASKERLFFEYSSKNQIINIDGSFGEKLARKWGKDAIVISIKANRAIDDRRFVFVRSIKKESFGSRIRINSSWGDAELYIPLIGDFNISNAVQVLAFLFIKNIEFKMACDAIENMTAPPGRIQYIKESSADTVPDIFIDYAHTPAALESALKALRPHTIKKLWCVFGCGGDRDQGKRKIMGQVVDKLADRIVVTNDNPRCESPMNIIQDILKGIKSNNVINIENRRDAIAHSITEAHHDDLILISGKGHENYQLIGNNRIVFSDYKCAVTNLGNRLQGVNI